MSDVRPDFTLPALTLEQMADLGRCLVGLERARDLLEQQLGCDPQHDPTVLALRSARAALELIYVEEVSAPDMRRVAQTLHAEIVMRGPEAGHG
jgi:hypothetical protein